MKYLLTYKLSQDHLEQFFGCVRRAGGSNNNPNAKQFVAIFKRLMFRTGVSLSPTDNANTDAQDDTSLVHVQTDKNQLNSMENIEQNELFEDGLDSRTYLPATIRLSPFIENVLVYMSGWVVRRVFSLIKCTECAELLACQKGDIESSVEGNALLILKDNGGLIHPTKDVVRVVGVAEKVLREMVNIRDVTKVKDRSSWGLKLETKVLNELPNDLFLSKKKHFQDSTDGLNNHLFSLVRIICRCFLNVRKHHICKMTNISLKKTIVRQSNNKLTLFKNQ